jgi:hypothetical protein
VPRIVSGKTKTSKASKRPDFPNIKIQENLVSFGNTALVIIESLQALKTKLFVF